MFTWRSHVAGDPSQVTLRFEPVAGGHTRLVLEHVGIEDDHRRAHVHGWTLIVDALAADLS